MIPTRQSCSLGMVSEKDPHRTNENFKGSPKIFTKLKQQRNEEMKSKHSNTIKRNMNLNMGASLFGLSLDGGLE